MGWGKSKTCQGLNSLHEFDIKSLNTCKNPASFFSHFLLLMLTFTIKNNFFDHILHKNTLKADIENEILRPKYT